MASNSQVGCAKRKRSPSPSPWPSQGGGGGNKKGKDGIANEESAGTDSSSDSEDPVEECKRRVPNNEKTRILISQLKMFHLIGYGLRQKEEEKRRGRRQIQRTQPLSRPVA